MESTINRIRCFWNRLSRRAQHYITVRETVRREITSDRTLEESADFVMKSYMRHSGKTEKECVRREAPPFRHIDT